MRNTVILLLCITGTTCLLSQTSFGQTVQSCSYFPLGNETVIQHAAPVRGIKLSPNGQTLLTFSQDRLVLVRNLISGEEHRIEHPEEVVDATFSSDGMFVASVSYNGHVIIKNLIDKTEKDFLCLNKYNKKLKEIKEKDVKILSKHCIFNTCIGFLDKSAQEIIIGHGKDATVLNIRTGIRKNLENYKNTCDDSYIDEINIPKLNSKATIGSSFKNVTIQSKDTTCVIDQFKVKKRRRSSVTCPVSIPDLMDKRNLKSIEACLFSEICTKNFDAEIWNLSTGEPFPNPILEDQAEKYLLRFQKPGGFSPEKHLPLFLAILRSSLPKNHPELIFGTLQNILHISSNLYEDLIQKFPEILKLKPKTKKKNIGTACRTKEEENRLVSGAKEYLQNLIKKNFLTSTLEDWEKLIPISPLLNLLPEQEKNELADSITASLVQTAKKNILTQEIPQEALRSYIKEVVKKYFNEKPKNQSSVLAVQKGNQFIPIIIGQHPIDGEKKTKTDYGFYVKTLKPQTVPKKGVLKKKITWTQNKKVFSARIQASVRKDFLIPAGEYPPYQNYWKDNQLTGMVIASSTINPLMEDEFTLRGYQEYLKALGFKFQAPPVKISDARKYLKEQIKTGKLDYLVRQVYRVSPRVEPNDKDIFSISKKLNLLVGAKKRQDGKEEKIYLLYSQAGAYEQAAISPDELMSWVENREFPFTYFNLSGWNSHLQTTDHLQKIRKPNLIEIASYSKNNTPRLPSKFIVENVLTAFRDGKSYEELLKSFQVQDFFGRPKALTQAALDAYSLLFPNTGEYEKIILDPNILWPLQIEIKY